MPDEWERLLAAYLKKEKYRLTSPFTERQVWQVNRNAFAASRIAFADMVGERKDGRYYIEIKRSRDPDFGRVLGRVLPYLTLGDLFSIAIQPTATNDRLLKLARRLGVGVLVVDRSVQEILAPRPFSGVFDVLAEVADPQVRKKYNEIKGSISPALKETLGTVVQDALSRWSKDQEKSKVLDDLWMGLAIGFFVTFGMTCIVSYYAALNLLLTGIVILAIGIACVIVRLLLAVK